MLGCYTLFVLIPVTIAAFATGGPCVGIATLVVLTLISNGIQD